MTEEQEIKNAAEKILAAKGTKSKYEYCQPESGLGGGWIEYTTETKFKKKGLTIAKYETRLDDEICAPSLMILDAGEGIVKRFFNAIGMYDGNLVFDFEYNKTKTFERGAWQKRLESLVS